MRTLLTQLKSDSEIAILNIAEEKALFDTLQQVADKYIKIYRTSLSGQSNPAAYLSEENEEKVKTFYGEIIAIHRIIYQEFRQRIADIK